MLNLGLVLSDPMPVRLQCLLHLRHVLLVRIDELRLLSLQHHSYLLLQVGCEPAQLPHQLLDVFDVVLNK